MTQYKFIEVLEDNLRGFRYVPISSIATLTIDNSRVTIELLNAPSSAGEHIFTSITGSEAENMDIFRAFMLSRREDIYLRIDECGLTIYDEDRATLRVPA